MECSFWAAPMRTGSLRSWVGLGGLQVLGPLFKPVVVNSEVQREEAEYNTRPFFLFLIENNDFCAPKGPRTHAMSPPLQD